MGVSSVLFHNQNKSESSILQGTLLIINCNCRIGDAFKNALLGPSKCTQNVKNFNNKFLGIAEVSIVIYLIAIKRYAIKLAALNKLLLKLGKKILLYIIGTEIYVDGTSGSLSNLELGTIEHPFI